MTEQSSTAAKNIALAGHYGSGKSSVILGVQAGLDEREIGWVNLSLSSLGIDETERARIRNDGSVAPLTNLIQKEIVKQLLYRKSPADMPASRYRRIDAFRSAPAALWSTAVGVAFFVLASLLGLVGRVERVAPDSMVNDREWASWAIVAAIAVFVGVVWFLGLRVLQSRLRVESVSAGGAAVSLSAKENSYFDEYLDEIVYFFQKTRTTVAIFEDLDRFKDPHIFETLRELNTVLNNSEQIRKRPIRFVYAVRDSIFEQLEVGASRDADEGRGGTVSGRASTLESAPSANRTKFFDLVVPMVPFITHRSARDLLAEEFAESDSKPSSALVGLVGAHLTDMRIIRNIRNEFEMYRASVLGETGLKGLTVDRLFAMMVYKNLHLDDFEAIRLGTSTIDEAHRAFRAMVDHQVDRQGAISRSAIRQARSSALWDQHAEVAGQRLQEVLPLLQRVTQRGGAPTVSYQSTTYDLASLKSGALWRTLSETREDVVVVLPGWQNLKLPFNEFVLLAGEGAATMRDAVDIDVAALQKKSRTALATKDWATKATMAEMIARNDLTMPGADGEQRSLEWIVRKLVSPLAFDFLAKGYIDENFTLYCSDYHAIAISVSAMNFILHSVQEDRADFRFRFDERSSIDAVEAEMGERFTDGESIFNIEVFDHYLDIRPAVLDRALDKLAVRAPTDRSFIDAYLIDGAAAPLLVRELTTRWPGIFFHLASDVGQDETRLVELVNVALQNARSDVDYLSSEEVAALFARHFERMDALVAADVDASSAAETTRVLDGLGVQIPRLARLGEQQRHAIVSSQLYPVTRENLALALENGSGLELDLVKATSAAVYEHLLANLADYLAVLERHEVTIAAPDGYVAVLADVLESDPDKVAEVAARASDRCEVADLRDLDEAAWPAIVASGRFAMTAHNVHLLIGAVGATTELLANIADREISGADELDADVRVDVAFELLNAAGLDPEARIRAGLELDPPRPLDPGRLTASGTEILAQLLAAGLVPDSAETYQFVADQPYESREDYFVASADLSTYVTELGLSKEDLVQIFRSHRVPAAVKQAVVDDVDFVSARISRQGAIAIYEWANKGYDVSAALLVVLGRADAPAEHVLYLLEAHLSEVDQDMLDEILRSLGDDYEPLTRRGHHRPRVKERPGTEQLLEELKQRGRVSSYGAAKWVGGIRVNMRHEE